MWFDRVFIALIHPLILSPSNPSARISASPLTHLVPASPLTPITPLPLEGIKELLASAYTSKRRSFQADRLPVGEVGAQGRGESFLEKDDMFLQYHVLSLQDPPPLSPLPSPLSPPPLSPLPSLLSPLPSLLSPSPLSPLSSPCVGCRCPCWSQALLGKAASTRAMWKSWFRGCSGRRMSTYRQTSSTTSTVHGQQAPSAVV